MGAINLSVVAQIANLLYGRLQIGRTLAEFTASGQSAVLQDGILRYSRLAVCATDPAEALTTGQDPKKPSASGAAPIPKSIERSMLGPHSGGKPFSGVSKNKILAVAAKASRAP